jgi:predicted metal-binding protein
MLIPVDDGVAVVVCTTCRAGQDGDGAALATALHRVRAADPALHDVAVQEMACLFACRDACTVHLRGAGRIGYVLGRFAPDEAAARAILDYARAYAASAEGEVAFADWPEGVKGHFLVRLPPPGYLVD